VLFCAVHSHRLARFRAANQEKDMATASKSVNSAEEILIRPVETKALDVYIVGTTPLIMNRMSQKTWFELLAPKGKKSTAEKASSLKHDPLQEFRASPYIMQDPRSAALLGVMCSGFKKAMGTAALRSPGVKKTEINQLVYVEGEFAEVFGIPKVFMAITRSADMSKTPDVRTRALLPEWACKLSVKFASPALRATSVANLLSTAGVLSGIGDWRQEKGSGSFGSFKLVERDDPDYLRIVKTQGRKAQQAAMDAPEAYNDETSEMLAWFDVEIKRRGFKVAA
jgi:hypothetical protein